MPQVKVSPAARVAPGSGFISIAFLPKKGLGVSFVDIPPMGVFDQLYRVVCLWAMLSRMRNMRIQSVRIVSQLSLRSILQTRSSHRPLTPVGSVFVGENGHLQSINRANRRIRPRNRNIYTIKVLLNIASPLAAGGEWLHHSRPW